MLNQMKCKLILVLLLCTLFIAGCSSDTTKTTTSNNPFASSTKSSNDDVYVMMKDYDLYIKYPEKDPEKVASDIWETDVTYYDGKGLVFLDLDSNLYIYENGEKQKIAKDIKTYSLSKNYNTLAYITNENDLYVNFNESDKIKVGSNVSDFLLADNGEFIIYKNDEGNLYYFTQDEQKDKIDSDAHWCVISEDSKKIAYSTDEDDVYIYEIKDGEKKKVHSGEDIWRIEINTNGDLIFMSEYDYRDSKAELYYYNSSEDSVKRIASDVQKYYKQDNLFYYLDSDENLYVKNIKEDKSEKIADSIKYFTVADQLYFIDEDSTLYSYKKDKKEKIGIDIVTKYEEYQVSFIEDNLIFLTKDNELFVNKEKLSTDVEDFHVYMDTIVFETKDKSLQSVKINKLDQIQSFENAKSYTSIYYGNEQVYYNVLSVKDVVGIWEFVYDGEYEYEYLEGFVEIKQSDSYGDYIDMFIYVEDFVDEDLSCQITKTTDKLIYLDSEYFLRKVSDNEWEISAPEEEYPVKLYRSSKEKLNQYIEKYTMYDDYDYDDYDDYDDDYDFNTSMYDL